MCRGDPRSRRGQSRTEEEEEVSVDQPGVGHPRPGPAGRVGPGEDVQWGDLVPPPGQSPVPEGEAQGPEEGPEEGAAGAAGGTDQGDHLG